MKKSKILFVLFFFIHVLSVKTIYSQTYSNSWINYSQNYYKFKIVSDGIYRITYNNMAAAGINVSSINPNNFQVFGRGEQQYVYIYNQIQGIMSPGDYIEFYAQKNDGWYDSVLYKNPSHQVDNSYSLFTDTATYFLTWNITSFNNRRLTSVTDNNFNAYQPESYVYRNEYQGYNNYYMEGLPLSESSSETVWDPEYAEGEGFYGSPFYLGGTRVYNVPTKNAYSSGNATVRFTVLGASNFKSLLNDHHVRVQYGGKVLDTIFEGYTVIRFQDNIPISSLGSNNTTFTFSSINDLGSGADRNAVAFIEISYPHTLDFEAKTTYKFDVEDGVSSKSYLNISNFNGGNNAVLYDLDNYRRILVVKNGSNYQTLVPNSNSRKSCFLAGESSIQIGVTLQPVGVNAKFKNYIALNPTADYLIITHKSLMGSNAIYQTMNDYAAYRSQTMSVLLADVEDLYDQFSYGINKNPMAIRNFIEAAYHQLQSPPKQLFVVGKAYYPQVYRKDNTFFNQTLVPSFGSPPSDILLSSFIADNTYKPAIATGRLAAKNLDQVDLYLDKVKLYEDPVLNPPSMWKKDALFFSGGDNTSLQNTIASYMKGYEVLYEDTSFGGNVLTYYKTSTDPIQVNLSTVIKNHINNGINMLNFFGHAAGVGFDISIDNPSEYSNYGKYPFLIANSCFAGDIFQPNVGTVNSSEAFILIRDKGAIAYLGSVTPGSPSYLNQYTKSFFKNYTYLSYGQPVGNIIKNSIQNIYSTYPPTKEVILTMTLHGDPSVILNSYNQPDYEITEKSLFTVPGILTSEYDSFMVNIVISNLGKAVNDSIIVEIIRILPDNKTEQLRTLYVKGVNYIDTLSVFFPLNKFDDLGRNSIVVRVDANSNVSEMSEANNVYTYNFEIKAADLKPVYPNEYAVIGNQFPTLKASTFYPLSANRQYVFQLDTTIYFNSPLLETSKIQSIGGVVEYTVNQSFVDSVVYYWRVSLDSTSTIGYNWRNSSFRYIPFATGWAQSHFFQFEKNSYQLTVFNKAQRKFEYINDIKVLKCINGIVPYIAWTEPQYQINGIQYSYFQCLQNGMKIAVINPKDGVPWYSYYNGTSFGIDGNFHCSGHDYASFEFSTETFPPGPNEVSGSVWFQRTADFIAKIPDGYYVLARSAQNSHITNWPEYLYKAYDSIGANFHRSIPSNRPYIIWGTKGNLGGAIEMIGDSTEAIISVQDSFTTKWTQGYMATDLIGPTKKWNSLSWKVRSQDLINTDEVHLSLIGVKYDGSLDTIIAALPTDTLQISQLNSRMPADIYPYCKLVVYSKDDSLHTPPYINHLQILYTEVPELAVAPKTEYQFHSDTIQRGDTMSISIAYKNLSNIDMDDSLLVKYWIVDNNNISHDIGMRRIAKIKAQDFVVDSFQYSTISLYGNCSFFVEINPINPLTSIYDQLELTHSNNSVEVPFIVVEDKSNPLLDVTFDGIHILDGDIVSARPEIIMTLLDDNKYIAIDDTTSFNIYISTPQSLARKRLYFYSNGVEQLQFVPAELPNNKAKVIFKPNFEVDGEYTLYVQAVDPTLNLAGSNDYQIRFSVINKSTITQLLNWPNPFTTRTHFVFTLTGSQIPDYMIIQVMTISGKVVREITMDELGPLHIGRNITEFAWDGTDDFGDRLANGVYLYRVITKINGEDIELRESGADSYFSKNFGKMYLMR